MNTKKDVMRFNEAVSFLPGRLSVILLGLPDEVKAKVYEIRLRGGCPLALSIGGKTMFVRSGKHELSNKSEKSVMVYPDDTAGAYRKMCGYSVYSHEPELKNGYLTLRGGHRAGICGRAVENNDGIVSLRDVSSINLRVAHEVFGCAEQLLQLYNGDLPGLLVAGAPCSGKTTVLRELVRRLSGGGTGRYYKVTVVDERGEIGAVWQGNPQNDLGECCDVLTGYKKSFGIETAVRCMSPDIVVCDEIGSENEAAALVGCLNSGVAAVVSVHAKNVSELAQKDFVTTLVKKGVINKIAVLKSTGFGIAEVINAADIFNQTDRSGICGTFGGERGVCRIAKTENAVMRA